MKAEREMMRRLDGAVRSLREHHRATPSGEIIRRRDPENSPIVRYGVAFLVFAIFSTASFEFVKFAKAGETGIALAGLSFLLLNLSVYFAARIIWALWSHRDIAELASLPADVRWVLWRQMRCALPGAALFGVILFLCLLTYASAQRLDAWRFAGLIGMSPVIVASTIALAVLLACWPVARTIAHFSLGIGWIAMISAMYQETGREIVKHTLAASGEWLSLLIPTGWCVRSALAFVLTGHESWLWFLLLVLVLMGAVALCMTRLMFITKLALDHRLVVTIAEAPVWMEGAARDEFIEALSKHDKADETEIRKAIAGREFLMPLPQGKPSLVDRLFWSTLNEEFKRVSLWICGDRWPRLGRRWVSSLAWLLVFWGIALVTRQWLPQLTFFVLVMGALRGARLDGGASPLDSAGIIHDAPLKPRVTMFLTAWFGLCDLAISLPLVIAHAAFIAWLKDIALHQAITWGVCLMLGVLALRIGRQCVSSRSIGWWRPLRWLAWALSICFILTLASASVTTGGLAMVALWIAILLLAVANAAFHCWLLESMRAEETPDMKFCTARD